MSEKQIHIGLLGLGTVGSGTVDIIQQNHDTILQKTGLDIHLKKALVRHPSLSRPVTLRKDQLTTDPEHVIENEDIDIIVEVMGSVDVARTYIVRALKQGKPVVTANKDLMALYGDELLQVAEQNHTRIFYEASVGAGIPLVGPLKQCLAANRIHSIMGIVNGTTNYILSRMAAENMVFAEALREAQNKGFAEQDPRSDLEGWDAAYKLAILSRLAFHSQVNLAHIYTESICNVHLKDMTIAQELGYAIKLLAIGEEKNGQLALRVHPAMLPLSHPLASVKDEFNAIWLEGDAVGEVMFYGRGAGARPTGSAVAANIIEAAQSLGHASMQPMVENRFGNLPLAPIAEQTSRFYLRIQAKEQPGVFGSLATAFGDEQISLDRIIQKGSAETTAEIILITHHVKEGQFTRALERIRHIPSIEEISGILRVQERRQDT